MNKKLKIKICGILQPQNIKGVDALNPDYIGFIFYPPSPRNMDKNPDAIPETQAKKVGVFVDSDIESIIKKATTFKLSTIQLHGSESPDICSTLTNLGYEVFKAFRVDNNTKVQEIEVYAGTCSAFLFDTKTNMHGGSGKKFDWKKLDELAYINSFFISGGIGANDAEAILKLNYKNLIGLDLNSQFEIEPGLKNISMLQKFLKNVKNY